MDSPNSDTQSRNSLHFEGKTNIKEKENYAKWKFLYLGSVPLGYLLASIILYYFVFDKTLNDEAGIAFQFWAYSSIILTPVFSFIIFTILNVIKNRGITRNLALAWAIIIFFIALLIFLFWFQANYLNK